MRFRETLSSLVVMSLLPLLAPASVAAAASPKDLFAAVSGSVVVVKVFDEEKAVGFGSGVVISPEEVLTNCHVVEKGTRFQVGRGMVMNRAVLLYRDNDQDLCLLVSPGVGGKPASLGRSAALSVGARVYAIGAPQGLELSLSDGLVAQLHGEADGPRLIQTTAPISPGSSGGGLFDEDGRLVGITTFYLKKGQNLNFAMPVDLLAGLRSQEHLVDPLAVGIAPPPDPVPEAPAPAPVAEAPQPGEVDFDVPEGMRVAAASDDAVLFVHVPTIRKGYLGYQQAWVLTNFLSPRYDPTDHYYFSSARELKYLDCEQGRMGTLQVTHFQSGNARGKQLWSSRSEPYEVTLSFVAPGTVGESLLDFVCGKQ